MKTAILVAALSLVPCLSQAYEQTDLYESGARSIVAASHGHFGEEYVQDFASSALLMGAAEVATYEAKLGERLPQGPGVSLVVYEVNDCVYSKVIVAINPELSAQGLWYIE